MARRLFYWYTESQSDPSKDPIVLWLNGGPGCASSNGFLTENGAFVAQADQSARLNPYAWNRKANVVWVDSPSGVGFSAPLQDPSYYNDDVVADRLHTFLRVFFDKYPELQGREFYITGESYAGIYIPFLVNRLVEEPLDGVNLTGFAIGNPLTDDAIDGSAYMDYYYSHALISRQNYHKLQFECEGKVGQCFFSDDNCTESCAAAVSEAYDAADADGFNHYYIYGDVCLLANSQRDALHIHLTDKREQYELYRLADATHRGAVGPCADTFTESFFNRPDVQKALHIEDAPVQWVDCQRHVSRNFKRTQSSLPKYRNILGRGLKVLIYSGDADSVVNFIGTERWITEDGLNLQEVKPWRSWIGPDNQIAGYVQEYDGLTFKTIKGAGHMVPAVRPLHGLNLFECFLYGDDVCSTFDYPPDPFELEAAGGGAATIVIGEQVVQSDSVVASVTDSTPTIKASTTSIWAFAGCAALAMAASLFAVQYVNRRRSHRRGGYESIDGQTSEPPSEALPSFALAL